MYRLDTRSKLLPLDNVRPHRIHTVVTSNPWGFYEQAVNVGGLSVVGPGERSWATQSHGQSADRTNDREHWPPGPAGFKDATGEHGSTGPAGFKDATGKHGSTGTTGFKDSGSSLASFHPAKGSGIIRVRPQGKTLCLAHLIIV